MGDAHISFTTTKIGSLLDCKNSKYVLFIYFIFCCYYCVKANIAMVGLHGKCNEVGVACFNAVCVL